MFKDVIAVTNRSLSPRPFLEQIRIICSLGPKALILREKDLEETDYEDLAREVIQLCQEYRVDCILHTFTGAAVRLRARRIHLPLPLFEELSGTPVLNRFEAVGTSVHSVEDAAKACRLGADYLTAGHIYATDCKKGAPPRGVGFLKQVCEASTVPVYAIGGIKPEPEMIRSVLECGAAGACVMSGMMRYEPEATWPQGGTGSEKSPRIF